MAPQYNGYPYYGPYNPGLTNTSPQQAYVLSQSVQPQIRSGGIVTVANEDEARRYPVAPGYTVTMRDETKPYLYEKTMGYSQLDQPIFRKARLVFEDDTPQTQESAPVPEKSPEPTPVYAELSQFALWKTMMVILEESIVITTLVECIAITIHTAIWALAEAMAISADTAEMKLRTGSLTRWKA